MQGLIMSEDTLPKNEVEVQEQPSTTETPLPVDETPKKSPKAEKKAVAKYYIPIEVGQEMTGKVKTLADFGAFIDLGLTVDGLVHISELSRRRVTDVKEVLEKDQEVGVWVKSVDRTRGRIGLTMLKPVERKYGEIAEGDTLKGEIKRIESYGVFVDVGLEREGLVHVSELSHEYVKSPADVVTVGDEVNVKVLKIDARKKQVNLSIKALLEPPVMEASENSGRQEKEYIVVEEDEEPAPTTMAVAFERVNLISRSSRRKAPRSRRRNKRMDAVVARTLKSGQKE